MVPGILPHKTTGLSYLSLKIAEKESDEKHTEPHQRYEDMNKFIIIYEFEIIEMEVTCEIFHMLI